MTAEIHDKYHVRTSLRQLTDDLVKSHSQESEENKITFINSIPPKIFIEEDIYQVATVMNGMLEAVINNTIECNIHINGKELFEGMAEISIRDENCYNAYGLALSLQNVVQLAHKVHGKLDIAQQRNKITTITFRFPMLHNVKDH